MVNDGCRDSVAGCLGRQRDERMMEVDAWRLVPGSAICLPIPKFSASVPNWCHGEDGKPLS